MDDSIKIPQPDCDESMSTDASTYGFKNLPPQIKDCALTFIETLQKNNIQLSQDILKFFTDLTEC